MNRFVIIAAVGIVAATSQYGAEVRHLTLTEAVHLAISQNRSLKIARLKVTENERKGFRCARTSFTCSKPRLPW